MTHGADGAIRGLVTEHVEAVNAHDRRRLLAGLAPDVTWSTGPGTFDGTQALAEMLTTACGRCNRPSRSWTCW